MCAGAWSDGATVNKTLFSHLGCRQSHWVAADEAEAEIIRVGGLSTGLGRQQTEHVGRLGGVSDLFLGWRDHSWVSVLLGRSFCWRNFVDKNPNQDELPRTRKVRAKETGFEGRLGLSGFISPDGVFEICINATGRLWLS